MTSQDIEDIERATVVAVSPQAQEEIAGWLLPFDTGAVWRAKSAVPLSHGEPQPGMIDVIESRYAARGMPAVLRLPDIAAFASFRAALTERGYAPAKPTHVQAAMAPDVRAVSAAPLAQTAPSPDEAWASVFVGEGFDPVEGASRVATLSRAPGALFASIREGEATVAAGMAGFSHGWASVHGMRTAQHCRGRGLAARVLATLADAALARGLDRMVLQVEVGNATALALYQRAGFSTAWSYSYWKKR
ncbi:GNAT family N-acetyltransferase [Ramlibacter sp. WS9]|uniref:GNAT family N-acetyltransferase n=1 Tax=Ramlibacter sp. WS9 TaxID=1882741 RepID=UPI001142C6ED|nr:GNAT family N-acetyltransferase [Ramlibacter sp. WS9]ROZ78891.1 GNAT family N-acetyltransferase [Ramlibacter sp. WS9]